MTQSLGAKLAQTIDDEKRGTRAAAERAASRTSAQDLREFRQVADFFDKARAFFTKGIKAGTPLKKLEFIVGTEAVGKSSHAKVYSILSMWDSSDAPRITQPKHAMHALWAEFTTWAEANGLEARWEYRHDGAGINSWFALLVKPSATALAGAAAPEFVNPNDVTVQHNYCLHVLNSTLHGYLNAVKVLQALQGHPVADAHLIKYEKLIAASRVLHEKLN